MLKTSVSSVEIVLNASLLVLPLVGPSVQKFGYPMERIALDVFGLLPVTQCHQSLIVKTITCLSVTILPVG